MVDEAGPRNGVEPSTDGDNRAPGSINCPACGVAVAPGYPKCPKCHARLPHVPSPLHRVGSVTPGGTSAAGGGASAGLWAVAGAIVCIAVAVVFIVMRGGGAGEVAADAGAGAEQETAAEQDTVAEQQTGFAAESFDDQGDGIDTAVLEQLNSKLAELRLWSSVEPDAADQTVVRIVSSHCEDAGLRSAVLGLSAELKDAGFVGVQCVTQHGALSFQREL